MVRKKRSHYVRDWRGQFARVASHRTSINTKELRASTSKRRKDVADAAQKQRDDQRKYEASRARSRNPNAQRAQHDSYVGQRNGNEVDTTPQTGVPEGKVSSSQYGMNYNEENEDVVERGRSVPDAIWSGLPVETLKHGTPLNANEEFLKQKSIDKVVNGNEEFREGYITKLWREPNGDLHIVDGHHRVAMYNALGKDMPVRIMDDKLHKSLVEPRDDVFVPETFRADERFAPLMQAYDEVKAKYGISRIDVTDKGAINDVAAVSFERDFQKPKNINPDVDDAGRKAARAKAKEFFWKGVAAAPEIRQNVRNIVARNGGTMGREYFDGEPTAVKTEHSLFRKIQDEMVEARGKGKDDRAEAVELKDSVRFTSIFDEDNYMDSLQNVQKEFSALGYRQIKPKPLPDGSFEPIWISKGYRGLNMAFERDDGLKFEFQAHTPRGLEIAELNHVYYNFSRLENPAQFQAAIDSGDLQRETGFDPTGKSHSEIRKWLDDTMDANAESIAVPGGVRLRLESNAIVDVKQTAHYRVTGEPIKKPGEK